VYFVFSPLIAMMGVVLICALVTYVAIPLLNKLGLEFNDFARRKRLRDEAIKKLVPALAASLEKHGLTWADIQDRMQ
jgi:ribonuclease HIII